LEISLNWLTIAALFEILLTRRESRHCTLSEPQIINTFKSDYSSGGGSAATVAGAQVSFERRPAIGCLIASVVLLNVTKPFLAET